MFGPFCWLFGYREAVWAACPRVETGGALLRSLPVPRNVTAIFVRRLNPMPRLSRSLLPAVLLLAGLPLGGCETTSFGFSNPFTTAAAPPPPPPRLPPSIHAEEIVGKWGLAAYHRDQDRARTQNAARSQCGKPYEIQAAANGGVLMLGHDNPQVQEMSLKGSVEGKTYVGPGDQPAGMDDREVVSFDGKVLILKWVDPEVAGRYGNMVLVRCEGKTHTAANRAKSAEAPE
jgi:hypothetical protein